MARGRSRGHKGGRKQFSNPDAINADLKKEEEKRRWREQHPDSPSESESEEEEKPKGKRGKAKPKDDSDSGSEVEFASGSGSSSEEEEQEKPKGAAGIELENPNRVKQKTKKVSALGRKKDDKHFCKKISLKICCVPFSFNCRGRSRSPVFVFLFSPTGFKNCFKN